VVNGCIISKGIYSIAKIARKNTKTINYRRRTKHEQPETTQNHQDPLL